MASGKSDIITRLRHYYGFGVHSPLAFRLLGVVVRPGRYSYYGYEAVEDALEKERGRNGVSRLRLEARLLLRLANFCGARRAVVGPGFAPCHRAALKAAYSGMKVARHLDASAPPDGPVLAVLRGGSLRRGEAGRVMKASPDALVMFGPSAVDEEEITEGMCCGILLTGRRYLIYIGVQNSEPVVYPIL